MHTPTSVLRNETHKLLWVFDIQADHLISANKKKTICKIVDFAVPADKQSKTEKMRKEG